MKWEEQEAAHYPLQTNGFFPFPLAILYYPIVVTLSVGLPWARGSLWCLFNNSYAINLSTEYAEYDYSIPCIGRQAQYVAKEVTTPRDLYLEGRTVEWGGTVRRETPQRV